MTTDTAIPGFFARFLMRRVLSESLDATLREEGSMLIVLFLWAATAPRRYCQALNADGAGTLAVASVHRLHNNVYDAPEMGARFGLHGIAAFFLCSGAKKNR